MKAGDRIAKINGPTVWTFGDLQYRYDQVDRKAQRIEMTVERSGNSIDLAIALPRRWWWTDGRFRQSSVEPRPYFEDRTLTDAEKPTRGLKPDGFASEVKFVGEFAKMMKST